MNRIREILIALSNRKIKISINENEEYHLDSQSKERITLSYQDTLDPEIFPWYMMEGVTRMTPWEVFVYYSKELVPSQESYSKNVLKISTKQKKKKKLRKILGKIIQQEPETKYCYCKKEINDVMMIGSFLLN